MRIRGKTAIVTGATSGIGRAVALDLAKRGANVALVARRTEELEAVAAEVAEHGVEALVAACDVGQPEEVELALAEVRRRFGSPHILVNAAGAAVWKAFGEISEEEHRRMMEVNYWGTFHWIRRVLPDMRAAGRGRIVNVAAGSGLFALPVTSGFSASKFAVVGLSQALHRELMGSGVGISVVNPGSVRTAFWNEKDIPTSQIPPLVRYSPKLSARAVARTVRWSIRLGLAVRTVPIFVNLLAKANGLWFRLGDLLLWRWFVPLVLLLLVGRVLARLLG